MPNVKDEKEKLPKIPFNHLAISLSGGGFRATAFHLGLLSYLSTKVFLNKVLLERTRIISTVSAGTFVGVKYITTIKKGGNIYDCYKDIYTLMNSCDLVAEALQNLSNDSLWKCEYRQRSLINAFADVYNERFDDAVFGDLWDETTPIHLRVSLFNIPKR